MSRLPMKYKRDLAILKKPTLVLIGAEDEVFYADRYETILGAYTDAKVHIVPGANHDGLLASQLAHERTANWFESVISAAKRRAEGHGALASAADHHHARA